MEEKLLKDTEWESFCSAMYNKDLETANASYQSMIEIKQSIINHYKEILDLKKDIEKLLTPLAN